MNLYKELDIVSHERGLDGKPLNIGADELLCKYKFWYQLNYDEFLKKCNLSGLADDYNKALINVGRDVKIVERDGSFVAKAVGIDETGSLIVEKDGNTQRIVAGEVSVRGLYGYV